MIRPEQQNTMRSARGAAPPRGDFTARQRDAQAAAAAAAAMQDETDEAVLRQEEARQRASVVNLSEQPLTVEEQAMAMAAGEVVLAPLPQPGGAIDLSTPEAVEAYQGMSRAQATGALGAVPAFQPQTVRGPRVVTIIGDEDYLGFIYGEFSADLYHGQRYKLPAEVADHLVRKNVAV